MTFVIILFFILIFLCELILRLLHPYNDTNPVPITSAPDLPYQMIPNTTSKTIDGIEITIDSDGLRDIKTPHEGKSLTRTFLVIGDSTTYGYGVDARLTFTERLETRANKNPKIHYSLINAGHSGFNLQNYITLLDQLRSKFYFEAIIIGVMGNDYTTNDLNYIFKKDVGISPGSMLNKFNVPPEVIKVLRNSALYLTIGNAIKGAKYKLAKYSKNTPIENNNYELNRNIKESLNHLEKISTELSSNVYLFYLPTKNELLQNEVSHKDFNKILENFAASHDGIFYYSLMENSEIRANIHNIYFDTDWVHPNANGHMIYCEAMLDYLRKNKVFSELIDGC